MGLGMRYLLTSFLLGAAISAFGQGIADQEAAWEKMAHARHDALVEKWGSGSDSEFREKLAAMSVRDQDARKFMMTLPQSQWTEALGRHQQEIDVALTLQLEELVGKSGWPTFRLVGVNGSQQAMLIFNHSADHDWQNKILPQLEKLAEQGEIDGGDLAAVVDKMLVSSGKPQRYGMNFKFVDGRMQMFAVEDPAHLAERRESVMLPPLSIYKHLLAQIYNAKETDEIVQPDAPSRSR
jgi:hypothetical protein